MSPRRPGTDDRSTDGRITNLLFAVFVAVLAPSVLIFLLTSGLTHGGVALAVTSVVHVVACVVTFGGARGSARRGTSRAVCPLLGIVLVVVAFLLGISILG